MYHQTVYYRICLEGLNKITKNLRQNSRCTSRDWNPACSRIQIWNAISWAILLSSKLFATSGRSVARHRLGAPTEWGSVYCQNSPRQPSLLRNICAAVSFPFSIQGLCYCSGLDPCCIQDTSNNNNKVQVHLQKGRTAGNQCSNFIVLCQECGT